MATSSLFAGNSRFSSDFASVIQRSVAIASLPITLLQQDKTKLDDQATALTSLNGKVSALQSSFDAVSSAFGSSSFSSSISDASAGVVTVSDAATTGSWSVNVSDYGASTTFLVSGLAGVADASSGNYVSSATKSLVIDADGDGSGGAVTISLNPANQSLQSLVDEINKVAGTKVQASIVNVGSTSAPSYKLSLQSRTVSPADIKLVDGTSEYGNTVAERGKFAQYSVNGANVQTDSRSVTLAPGVKLDLKRTTTEPFTVGVDRSTSSVSTALGNLISAFNGVVTEMDKSRGQTNSALRGNSILNTVQSSLRQLVNMSVPGGGFSSLADLGVSFDKQGKLYLDNAVFSKAVDSGKVAGAKTFFGSTSSSGFLKSAGSILDGLTNSTSGVLSSAITTTQDASKAQQAHIDEQQERVDNLEKDLQARMAAADAAIAMLEQQATYFTNVFQTMAASNKNNS